MVSVAGGLNTESTAGQAQEPWDARRIRARAVPIGTRCALRAAASFLTRPNSHSGLESLRWRPDGRSGIDRKRDCSALQFLRPGLGAVGSGPPAHGGTAIRLGMRAVVLPTRLDHPPLVDLGRYLVETQGATGFLTPCSHRHASSRPTRPSS